jgi:hypothetical protein
VPAPKPKNLSKLNQLKVAELMGLKRIPMIWEYARLSPAHKQSPLDKLAEVNRRENAAPPKTPNRLLY